MPNNRGPQAGPPPVQNDAPRALSVYEGNFLTIRETLTSSRNADGKQILSMFGGDKELMNRFMAVAFSTLAANSDLISRCTPMSVIQAVKDAASLGLEPTGLGGEGAIVRYGDTAQFQPMWRGYLKRIRNSGKVQDVDCQIVYMNDEFNISLGTDPSIHHVPKLIGERDEQTGELLEQRGDYRGVYAWALMPSGKYIIEWLTTGDINEIRDHFSTAYRNDRDRKSPWSTSWSEMARKTVIRRLAKRLPGEAVDSLLRVEAKSDAAEAAAVPEQASVKVSEAQKLALAAVAGNPAAPVATESENAAQQTSEKDNSVAGAIAKVNETLDTDPVELERKAAEIRDLADADTGPSVVVGQCAVESPFDGSICVLAAGHPNNHRDGEQQSWN
jgi:recombination protein RecT